jgi:hypothetical protein
MVKGQAIPGSPVFETSSYLQNLLVKAPRDVVEINKPMVVNGEAKHVQVTIPAEQFGNIEILHITDVQFGHQMCRTDRLLEYRDWILAKPNRFTLFGGDMIDAATALSVQSPFENLGDPQWQVYNFVQLVIPMRHRIIGYVGGNHERRTAKGSVFGDAGKLIATLLGVPYSSGQQFVDIYYGDHQPFKNSLWHGGGAARTKGARAQMLAKFMEQGDSHMYWVGHLHDVVMLGSQRVKRDPVVGHLEFEKFSGVMSSSFLDHFGTFAEVSGMAPNDLNMWRVVLEPNGKWELTLR